MGREFARFVVRKKETSLERMRDSRGEWTEARRTGRAPIHSSSRLNVLGEHGGGRLDRFGHLTS